MATGIEPRHRAAERSDRARAAAADAATPPRRRVGDAQRTRPSVMVIDERQLILDALVALIRTSGRFDVMPCMTHDADAAMIAATEPDLVVVGAGHLQEHPLRLLEALHAVAPQIETVIIADVQDPELIQFVLDNRVSALVLTASTAEDLSVTLDQVRRGQTALPAGWQAVISDPAEDPVGSLSERQLEVLRLLADGCTYDEIARRLVITVNTVKFHVRSIYVRLGVGNRIAARKLLEAHEPRHIHALAV